MVTTMLGGNNASDVENVTKKVRSLRTAAIQQRESPLCFADARNVTTRRRMLLTQKLVKKIVNDIGPIYTYIFSPR